MKKLLLFALLSSLFSCNSEKPLADLIVTNAKIYTVNEGFETAEAFEPQSTPIAPSISTPERLGEDGALGRLKF